MRWQDKAAELKLDKGVSWSQLPHELEKIYKRSFTFDQARTAVRRHPRYNQRNQPVEDIHSIIQKALGKEHSLESLADKTGATIRMVKAAIEDLKDEGIQITETNGKYIICRDVIPQENHYDVDWNGDKIIRFALMGDTQFNSKYCQITHLHNFYDICEREGITKVYHTGDIDEGEEMRVGHKYECYTQGADEHVEEIVKNYPRRNGITTEFVTGNHDHSLIKRAGFDIGRSIEAKRNDLVYLGMSAATIHLTPNCILELRHPLDGTAYAISYKTQKMIDAMHGGEKPNILAIGHYHKQEYIFYRNVHAFQTGCFQGQTSWMKGKQIAAMVGGWIIEIHVNDEGTITRCKGEFIPYYQMIKDDWKNWR